MDEFVPIERLVRSTELIGSRIAIHWMEGVGEGAQEEVAGFCAKHQQLFPAGAKLFVGWGYEGPTHATCLARRLPTERQVARLLSLHDGWWREGQRRREHDFVVCMLVMLFMESGYLRERNGQTILETWDGPVYGDHAVNKLHEWAASLSAAEWPGGAGAQS